MRKLAAFSVAVTVFVVTWAVMSRAADDRVRESVAPDHQETVFSEKIHGDDEPGYRLALRHTGQETILIDDYWRGVDVIWSPDSQYVAVTNWAGSNLADRNPVGIRQPDHQLNMTETLPHLSVNPDNSHFYVSCSEWEDPVHVAVWVTGHTDALP